MEPDEVDSLYGITACCFKNKQTGARVFVEKISLDATNRRPIVTYYSDDDICAWGLDYERFMENFEFVF